MKENVINFFRAAFPFLITIALWRLSTPFWNPAGVLAMIPIFYYSFVRRTAWFTPFAILMCFLLDYQFNSVCLWMAIYCLGYSVNGFQSYIDISRMDMDGAAAFLFFIGIGLIVLLVMDFSFANLIRGMWIFAWSAALYLPSCAIFKRVAND